MLTDTQKARLEELRKKKKTSKLDDKEFKEFKDLMQLAKKEDKEHKFRPGNDFSWWNKLPDLLTDSANFKSNYVAGRPIGSFMPFVIPGVVSISLETCYMCGNSATDPINVWARDLYLRMFQKYRPASGYTASDLAIALMAAIEAVKLIASYERIYGIINRYSIRNVNMPEVEAAALDLTPVQLAYLQGHLSDFRYDLNYLIRKAQRLCIPKDMAILEQAISFFGYEYLDHESPRAQILLFKLESYGEYSDTLVSSGGEIQYYTSLSTDMFDFTLDNMCKALDIVLNALLGSDSIQRIFADLIVWFGEGAMLHFNPIPEDYVVVPVYSESILHEFHNLTTLTGADKLTVAIDAALSSADQGIVGNGNYHVYQVDDRIVTLGILNTGGAATPQPVNLQGHNSYVLCTSTGPTVIENAHLINGFDPEPSQEFVIEGCVLKYVAVTLNPATNFYCAMVTSNVNYIVRNVKLYNSVPNSTPYRFQTLHGSLTAAQNDAGVLACIDWAPLSYYWVSENLVSDVFGDIDVPIPVTRQELQRIHRTATFSCLHTDIQVIKN